MNKKKDIAVEVFHVYKDFKVYYDKVNTIKEKILFWNRQNVEKRRVLEDISLEIPTGQVAALVGTNGSGKSTLLKLMTKIIYPTKGHIKVNGKLASLLELGAGFHQDFSGRENIYFNASIFGLSKEEIDKRLQTIIDFSELEEFIDNPIRTYSSGMYMRLAFSIAINVDADILLIDEILAVGDEHFKSKCYNKIEELKKEGKTIVMVTHDSNIVRRFCDRVIWLRDGQVKEDGPSDVVVDHYLEAIK